MLPFLSIILKDLDVFFCFIAFCFIITTQIKPTCTQTCHHRNLFLIPHNVTINQKVLDIETALNEFSGLVRKKTGEK